VRTSVPKTRIVAAFGKRSSEVVQIGGANAPDATLEFAAESAIAAENPVVKINRKRWIAGIALALGIGGTIAAAVFLGDRATAPAVVAGGSLRIESDPAGAEVRLNGEARGTTPLSLAVPAGKYTLTVQQGTNVKELPVAVVTGETTVHHITWTENAAAAVETGSLSIATDLVGSQVVVDGQERGVTPIVLRDLAVGEHRVQVRARGTTYSRTVQIEAGSTASLFIGGTAAANPGSVVVVSPTSMQIFEEGRLIGTTDMDRIMLPIGEHELELVAEPIGFRAFRSVRVTPGQTTTISVDLPRAALSINAVPWAEVFIDGTRVGETPLGNILQTLGPHEVVFRHPQLGERRMTTVVTTKETNRISVDMRQR
jgi:hypothetical protein